MIYLDNAATTPVHPGVLKAMLPYLEEQYGNPSGIYEFAEKSKEAVDRVREIIAASINAKPGEIYFTSGGTESDNWALAGMAEALGKKGKHIITTSIEHHAVINTCEYLKQRGFDVTYLDVNKEGIINPKQLSDAVRKDTILISIMAANNEIGSIQPLAAIGALAKEKGILFHTDAVQAFGHIPIDVDKLGIDMLSASGHKINGPKGIGIMYIRRGLKTGSFIHGGAQERHRRAGTHNVTGIAGMGKALEIAKGTIKQRAEYETNLRNYLIDKVMDEIPYTRLNGHREQRLPNNASFCFRFIEGESLVMLLDQNGICASSGSACTSGSLDPSHVLLAIGLPHEIAHGSLRLTLSEKTTKEDIDFTVGKLKEIVEKLRSMSPLYEDFIKQQ